MTRDVISLLAFAALTVLLVLAWVVGFWDGIVVQDQPSSVEASKTL